MRWGILGAALLVCAGCRTGFEGTDAVDGAPRAVDASADAAPVDLMVETAADRIRLSAPGRFTLDFDGAANWQAASWRDNVTGDLTELGGTGPGIELGTVQTIALVCNASCVGADDMEDAAMTVKDMAGPRVTLENTWTWDLGGQALSGTATHVIDSDGQWEVTFAITNDSAMEIDGFIELADSHVNPSLNWLIANAIDNTRFSYELVTDSGPRPSFEVTLTTPGDWNVQTDELGNRYFARDAVIAADETVTGSWTNRLWPPR